MTAVGDVWDRARALYPADAHLPQPTWATRGLPDGPEAAWDSVARIAGVPAGPLSVYVHLPFCETRCPFCDCHATIVPRGTREDVDRYAAMLLREIARWELLPSLAERPVTTVHFGGGTPLALGNEVFAAIVSALRDSLGTHVRTEWALETTSRLLTDEHLELLAGLGFSRVHVGVQSLQPELRRILGRRERRSEVLSRIAACLERGWVVSADLLYGLPGQSVAMLAEDIELLAAARVDGVSLYHLNAGSHNTHFMEMHGLGHRDEARLREDFALLAEGAALLESLGYRKNHVTHFARERDRNLYSRHAVRGEDLLALGSSADGVLGPYFYRHAEVEEYVAGDTDASPAAGSPLAGGGPFAAAEMRARPLVVQLMAGEVKPDCLGGEALALCERFEGAGLLERADDSTSWRLTTAGTWFSGAMCAEAWALYAQE